MESIGAAVGIIIDDKDNENPERIIMSDDGTGGGIRIPSMMISNTDGKKLINFLRTINRDEFN